MSETTLRPILIADDESEDEWLIRKRLQKARAENPIVSFPDGEDLITYLEALVRTGGEMPRLLFLDLKMPRVDGFDALAWIRGQRACDGLNVAIITSSSRAEDVERAMAGGARRVFTKFPSAEEIAQTVAAYS